MSALSPQAAPESEQSAADARLVQRITGGDRDAESELVHRFERQLLVMLLARTRHAETARDLAQNVFVAAISALRGNRIQSPERLAAFVHGIARNLANNHIRERATRPEHVEVTETSAWVDGRDQFERAQRLRQVHEELARMEPADQQVLRLTLVDGMKSGEIARSLGLKEDVVRARKSRALKRLTDRVQGGSQSAGRHH